MRIELNKRWQAKIVELPSPKSLCHVLTLAAPRSTSRPIEPILSSSRLSAATVFARQQARFNAPLTRSDLIKFGS
jgi:hypothetical protein